MKCLCHTSSQDCDRMEDYMYKIKSLKAIAIILAFVIVFTLSSNTVVKAAYPTWQAGTTYKTGDIVSYGSNNYQCIQGHTALTGWEPPIVPALWSLYSGGTTQTVATPVCFTKCNHYLFDCWKHYPLHLEWKRTYLFFYCL